MIVMTGTVYGYARVSTRDQNLDRQLDALVRAGVNPGSIFSDKASGRDFNRPAWARLMGVLGDGDVLFVKSIDRLGRNYDEILAEWRRITHQVHADLVVLDMPLLDTRCKKGDLTGALISDIVLQLLSYVAQIERENIRQRQAEGIAAAKARGVRFGRPRKKRPQSYLTTKRAYLAGELTKRAAAARLGICVGTFDRWLKDDEDGRGGA